MGGLTIIRSNVPETGLTADRWLYVTGDDRVVEEGSLDAAFLLATPGTVIPAERARVLGLEVVDGRIVQRPKEPPAPLRSVEELVKDQLEWQKRQEPAPPVKPPATPKPPKRAKGA